MILRMWLLSRYYHCALIRQARFWKRKKKNRKNFHFKWKFISHT